MDLVLAVLLVIFLILLANLAALRGSRTQVLLFDLLLLALNIPLFLLALALAVLPAENFAALGEAFTLIDTGAAAAVLFGMAVWGMVMSLRPVRRLLARFLPLDPLSPVHALALVLSGYLIGNTFLALSQDILVELAATEVTVSIVDLLVQQAAFVVVAFLGVGLLMRRDLREVQERLGLQPVTLPQIRLAILWVVLLVMLQWVVGVTWAVLNPEEAELLGSLNESLLVGFDTVWEWLVLALAAGIGEEILFRGALQPVLGLIGTSLLFAFVHVQYGISPVTLAVFVIGIALGLIRRRTSTSVAILVHFGYNFVLGLFSLLAGYLQQFVG